MWSAIASVFGGAAAVDGGGEAAAGGGPPVAPPVPGASARLTATPVLGVVGGVRDYFDFIAREGSVDHIGSGSTCEVYKCRLKAGVVNPFGELPEEMCVKVYNLEALRRSPEFMRKVRSGAAAAAAAGRARRLAATTKRGLFPFRGKGAAPQQQAAAGARAPARHTCRRTCVAPP